MGTRGTVNHMPGMDKSGNIHWIYWWAFATFIPVGITFFLSWYFGAPGGYQPYSLIKLFLLFLQTGFVTAYLRLHFYSGFLLLCLIYLYKLMSLWIWQIYRGNLARLFIFLFPVLLLHGCCRIGGE